MKLKHRQAFVLGILYRLECIQLMRAADVALFVFCIHITDEYAEYTVVKTCISWRIHIS